MNRRHILVTAALATPFTGCLGRTPQGSNTAEPTETDSTEREQTNTETNQNTQTETESCELENGDDKEVTRAQDGFPHLGIEGDEIPSNHESGLETSVRMTRQPSEDAPAQFEIAVLNGGHDTRRFAEGGSPPFSTYVPNNTHSPALLLVPNDRTYVQIQHINDEDDANELPDNPIEGCWQIESLSWNDIELEVELEPCDVLRETYAVVATGNDGCLPAGEYHFESEFRLPDIDTGSMEWGFTLTVTDPDET